MTAVGVESKVLSLNDWKGKEHECTELIIANKGISTLPTSLISFPNLEELDSSNNQIFQIPIILSRLPKLSTLKLSSNLISLVSLPKLENLKQLFLNNNRIKNISEKAFSSLEQLEILDLSNNLINKIAPNTFSSLKNLNSLQLNDNLLTELPNSIFSIQSLLHLNIQNNQINQLPGHLLSERILIQIDGNPLVTHLIQLLRKENPTNTVENKKGRERKAKGKRRHSLTDTGIANVRTQSMSFVENQILEIRNHQGESKDKKRNQEVKFSIEIPKDKKLRKRYQSDKKNKQAITILKNAMKTFEKLYEKEEVENNEDFQSIFQSFENSISLLSKKQKEKSPSPRKLKQKNRTNSLPSLNKDLININRCSRFSPRISKLKKNLIDTEKKESENDLSSDPIPNDNKEDIQTLDQNSPTFKRLSRMRRGNTIQNCSIHTIEDEELAFSIEIIDNKPEKILVGGQILSIFRYLIYHDRSMFFLIYFTF